VVAAGAGPVPPVTALARATGHVGAGTGDGDIGVRRWPGGELTCDRA
jgi:hypothetical protein